MSDNDNTRRIIVDQKVSVWTRRVFEVPEDMTNEEIAEIIDQADDSLSELYDRADIVDGSMETLWNTESVMETHFIPDEDDTETAFRVWKIEDNN